MEPVLTFPPVVVEPPGARLRRMALQIQTVEQFNQILDDVEGPDGLRQAVRDMLLPLVPQEVAEAMTRETEPANGPSS